MGKNIDILQQIQDAFSRMLGLSCLLTTNEGESITNISSLSKYTRMVVETKDIKKEMVKKIDLFRNISKPIILDSEPGIKAILSPIQINSVNEYFVWSGFFVDVGTKEIVEYQMEQQTHTLGSGWEIAIRDLPEISADEKRHLLNTISVMTEVITNQLNVNVTNSSSSEISSINHYLKEMTSGNTSVDSVIKRTVSDNNEIEFMGIAKRTEADLFTILHYDGPASNSVIKSEFTLGEGVLGYVVATGEGNAWEHAAQDTRAAFFRLGSIKPISLFCYPLFCEGDVIGVLFGGSISTKLNLLEMTSTGETLSLIVSVQMRHSNMANSLDIQLMKLSMFNDIFQLMTKFSDPKRILFLLIDIGINLINAPFACAVLKPTDGTTQATIVSRGMTSAHLNHCGQNIAQKYFFIDKEKIDPTIMVDETYASGLGTLYVPIVNRGEVIGCLGIGFPKRKDIEDYQSLLSNLATAAGMAIVTQIENTYSDKMVDALHLSLSQFNPQEFHKNIKENEYIESFSKVMNIPEFEIDRIIKANKIKLFDVAIIENTIPDDAILSLVKEFKNQTELGEEQNYSIHSQILFLVWYYVEDNNIIYNMDNIHSVSNVVKNSFLSFITQSEIIEQKIEISDKPTKQSVQISDTVEEQINLSKREKEVLNLVVQGLSNKDIASSLYISDHTVKNHLTNIFQKLNVNDRTQAIAKVYQLGVH